MAYDDKTFKATKIFNIEFIEDLNDTLDDITTDVENLEQTFEEKIETLENKIPEKLVYDASSLTVYSKLYGYGDEGSLETLYYFGFNNQTNAETFFGKTMVELGNLFKNNGSITFNNLQVPYTDDFGTTIYLDRTLHCVYPYAIDYKEALGDTGVIALLEATSVDTAMNFSSESISVKSSGTFLSRMGLYLLDYVDGNEDPQYSMIFYFIYDPVVDLGVVYSLYDPFPELAPPCPAI